MPIEPAAETMPKPRLRRSGTMTRAATLAAMPLVVHESATPTSTPVPSVIIAALVARAVMARPSRIEQRAEDGDAARPEAVDQRAGERAA